MRLIDVHAHLNDSAFESDLCAVMQRAAAAGVDKLICVGTDLTSSARALALAEAHPGRIFASAGIHPTHYDELTESDWPDICELARHRCVVAVGETGLDYHRNRADLDVQFRGLRRHLELAESVGKPVILHVRKADEDALRLLADFPLARGVRHCFDRPWALAQAYLELGFHISIGAAVTRSGYSKFKEAAGRLPAERLLLETDCPYQSPAAHAGKRNEPAFLLETLAAMAEIREEEPAAIAARTTENAERLFKLSL